MAPGLGVFAADRLIGNTITGDDDCAFTRRVVLASRQDRDLRTKGTRTRCVIDQHCCCYSASKDKN
jgi:hypothetical protein